MLTCFSYLPGAFTCVYHILYHVATLLLTCFSYLPGAFTCVYHILYPVTTLLLTGSYLPHLLPICHICCPAANPFSPIYLVITSVLPSSPIYLVIAPIQVFWILCTYNWNSQSQPRHSKHTGRTLKIWTSQWFVCVCKFELRSDLCGCACLLTGLFCMIILYCSLVCFLSIDEV